LIFWVAAVFLLPVSPIWPPRRPFLPYGRPNLALAGILVSNGVETVWTECDSPLGFADLWLYSLLHTHTLVLQILSGTTRVSR